MTTKKQFHQEIINQTHSIVQYFHQTVLKRQQKQVIVERAPEFINAMKLKKDTKWTKCVLE